MKNKEALVIGLGISGCTAARMLADAGYSVTCFESESRIGGILFDELRPNGVRVQSFGPHIFHTNNENVYSFLKRFGSFFPYQHHVLVSIGGKRVPLPLNPRSLEILFGEKQASSLLSRIASAFPEERRVSVDQLTSSGDAKLIDLGRFMIENILSLDLNRKEGSSFLPADDSFMNDAFVETTSDDSYYTDKIQAMPMQGFTDVMERMIDHPAINVFLNQNALSRLSFHEDDYSILLDGIPFKGPVVYTPSLDKLFDYRFGALPYRAGTITFKDLPTDFQNECAVIFSPKDNETIRMTESKYLTLQVLDGQTSLCCEGPFARQAKNLSTPFEPEITSQNLELYGKYQDLAKKYSSLHLLGRIACYKNLSIAECIEQASDFISSL